MPRGPSIISTVAVRGAFACICFLASCDRGKNETTASGPNRPAETEHKADLFPPLPERLVDRIVNSSALVKLASQPDQPGILLEGARGSSARRRYLVLCDAPSEQKSVYVAYRSTGGIEKALAKFVLTTETGVSIFEFTTKSKVECAMPGEPKPGATFHAIRLQGEEVIDDQEKAKIDAEIESIQRQKTALGRMLHESRRMRMERDLEQRRSQGGDPRQRAGRGREEDDGTVAELAALAQRESGLRARRRFPIGMITGAEVAGAETLEELETKAGALDHTLLVDSAGAVRGIRRDGKWIDLNEIVSSTNNRLEDVKLGVRGNNQSVSVACSFEVFPTSRVSYSMVAATTFELESMGSGSLEERLARVEPVTFDTNGGSRRITWNLNWNGTKTNLWIKVFNDEEPEKPILDEVVLLEYPDFFSARWGKPPSPLIVLPPAEPDNPEDLVQERQVLDARGPVRDMVAAGDGSTLMVQTTRPPYWQQLDLKTGQWVKVPWQATADTLLAAQAGKIYLLSKATGILEIRDLASGKRDGMQLLPVEGTVVAMASPLLDADRPVFVATDKNAYLLDPARFEVIPAGLDLESCFVPGENGWRKYPRLDARSISLRASADGTLYSISGTRDDTPSRGGTTLAITLNRERLARITVGASEQLPARGRYKSKYFPDHGGNRTGLMPVATSGGLPGPPGEIRFVGLSDRKELAVIRNPPLLPAKFETAGEGLLPDRRIYHDSGSGVVLLPDGDQLHLLRVKLPEIDAGFPEFCFPGETVEIPLPPGSGHELVTDLGGSQTIGATSIRWTVPPAGPHRSGGNLTLKWNGELGSPISRQIPVNIIGEVAAPVAESPDGTRKIPLKRRAILPDIGNRIAGIAGAGHVLLARGKRDQPEAWHLSTGEKIFTRDGPAKEFLGDADQLYLVDRDGTLVSHDLHTGKLISEVKLGESLQAITAGMGSRLPLLAVERESHERYLMQIPRDSLKPVLADLPRETRMRFFIPRFGTNASGSATWSMNTAVFRDGRAITLKMFDQAVSDGVPDATGRYIVNSREILDIGASPPKQVLISSLSGMDETAACEMDASGRYLLLSKRGDDGQWFSASVRGVRSPEKELFKLRLSGQNGRPPVFISSSNTLLHVMPDHSGSFLGVYDCDIPAILQQLGL